MPNSLPVAKKCAEPRVSKNGRVLGEDFHYPNTIEFVCNQGYILTPAKSVWRCSENGKWEDNEKRETNFPMCERKFQSQIPRIIQTTCKYI